MVTRSRMLLLVVALVLAPLPGPTAPASAAEADLVVQAGGIHPDNPLAPYEFTRFYPGEVEVHRGQTVQWNFVGPLGAGFHTVTFLPGGDAAPRPPFLRSDEVGFALGEQWAFGTCGKESTPERVCVVDDGNEFVSSGAPFEMSPFMATFDVPPGEYTFFCTVHPTMRGVVRVVDDATPVKTQAEVDEEIADAVRADAIAADAVFQAGQVGNTYEEDGRTVHEVRVGATTADQHVEVMQFLPNHVDAQPGDLVRFVVDDGYVNSVHTVTFPSEASGGFSPGPHGLAGWGFLPACDPDDRATGASGIPGLWGLVGPPCPFNTEFRPSAWLTQTTAAPGNALLTPATYHDSGIVSGPDAHPMYKVRPDGHAFPEHFDAEVPVPGSFAFECNIHPDAMTGSIAVG